MKESPHPETGSPADWLRIARADLALASMVPPSGVLLEHLCFHAQQAAEKALKAVIVHRTGEEPERTHNLRRLLHRLKPTGAVPDLDDDTAARLTLFAALSRYPADLGEVDEPEWRAAVADARAVVEWAEVALTST